MKRCAPAALVLVLAATAAAAGAAADYTGSLLYFPAHRLAVAVQANGDCGVRENLTLDWALALPETLVGP